MPEQDKNLQKQIDQLKNELSSLRYVLFRKTGLGSSDIKGSIVAGVTYADLSIPTSALQNDSVDKDKLDIEQLSVTVSSGSSTGNVTITSGSIVIGFRPTGNNDQFVDNIAISGTTLTITLANNATLDNTFEVTLLKA